jgi:AraC-like DNA-binding protein/response regulator of citrate/malate metabolism
VHDHLVARGLEVEWLATADQADWLERAMVAPPGAIVLDYEPAADRGWELMQVLRQNPETQDIPVVFYALPDDLDQGAALTIDYLIKPVGNVDMARALQRQGFGPEMCDRSRTILVVDDDVTILDLHERVLKGLAPECHIVKAPGGRQALELMERKTPDLVLLDLMMPEIDGFAVLEAMRNQTQTREVPVIVVTAQVLSSQDMARLQRGVTAVLGKGLFSGAEVLAQVEAALRRSKRLGNEAQRVVRQAMAYIHEHYAEPLSREELASRVGLSDRYLTRCFRQETGVTPITYLNRYRSRQARTLLERGDLSVTEVAFATGFSDPNYFGRVFRAEVGVSPRAYQRGERTSGR